MIQRVVLIKLTDEYSKKKAIEKVAEKSRKKLPSVTGVREVTVGLPKGKKSRKDWDICLTLKFDSIEHVDTYIDDPVHRAYVDDFLRPRLRVIKAWNFDIS